MHELFPPFRFRCVADGVFAGSYPTLRNLRFLQRLNLKTIICLIPEPPVQDLIDFCQFFNIALIHQKIKKYKEDSFHLPPAIVFQIIELLFDTSNLPVYVHCLDGAQICSGLVMCLRKCMNWKMKAIEREASRYCSEVGKDMSKYVKHWETSSAINVPDDALVPAHFASLILPERIPELPCGIRLIYKQTMNSASNVASAPSVPIVQQQQATPNSAKPNKKKKQGNIIDSAQAKKLPAFVDPPILKRNKLSLQFEALLLECKRPLRYADKKLAKQEWALPVRILFSFQHYKAQVESYFEKDIDLFDPTSW